MEFETSGQRNSSCKSNTPIKTGNYWTRLAHQLFETVPHLWFGHHPNFVSFPASIAELGRGEKSSRTQSVIHSIPALFDAPGTEALALRKVPAINWSIEWMSVLPVQVTPLPVYPVLQVQVKLSVSGTLMQVANSLHPPLLLAHSSTSVTSVHYTNKPTALECTKQDIIKY